MADIGRVSKDVSRPQSYLVAAEHLGTAGKRLHRLAWPAPSNVVTPTFQGPVAAQNNTKAHRSPERRACNALCASTGRRRALRLRQAGITASRRGRSASRAGDCRPGCRAGRSPHRCRLGRHSLLPLAKGLRHTVAHMVAWVNSELMKNVTEIGQLRLLQAASSG